MKKTTLALMLLLSITMATAQSYAGAKMYGFQQTVSGGKRPTKAVGENNQPSDVAYPARKNTWVYLVMPAGVSATVSEIYIDGKRFKVKSEKVIKTPVVYTDASIPDEPKTTVMVPQTKQTVLLLTPIAAQPLKTTTALQKLVGQNEAVVGYTVKGKKYYTSLKKFSWLEPALMQ